MRLSDGLLLARRLSTVATARRGLAIFALLLGERLLVTAATWALFRHSLDEKIFLAFALGAVFSSRAYAQYAFRARTEADLMERVVVSLIGGDVLRANVLPDEDARAELVQAVYHAAQAVSVELPLLAADAVAAGLLTLLVALREPGRVAGVAVGMTVFATLGLLATRRSMDRSLARAWTAQHRVHARFVDALEGRLDVITSGRRSTFLEEMRTLARAWAVAGSRVAAGSLFSNKLPLLAIAVAVAAAIALLAPGGQSAVGVTAADLALLASMTPAFSGFAQRTFALARAQRWMALVAQALEEPAVVHAGTMPPPALPAPIVFEGVTFRYEGSPRPALRDLSFAWRLERVLAFAGANGSGKSTCLRLLMALAPPQSGVVTVGGVRMDELDAEAWRGKIAFLPQRAYLPPRSDVRGAIHFLVPEATDEILRHALDRVGLLGALSRASGDPLVVRIDSLSVGERQRVGLARLLCQRASLVLLDEPDANLDRAGIALVASLVRELARDSMVAIAAHTTELLDVADRVVLLDSGSVAGGAPNQLAAR